MNIFPVLFLTVYFAVLFALIGATIAIDSQALRSRRRDAKHNYWNKG